MRRWLFLLVYFFFLLSITAYAGNFEISPFIGGYFFEDDENLKDKPVYGVRLGYGLSERFGIEGVFEYVNTRVDDRSEPTTDRPPFGSPDGSVKNYLYHLDALYNFLPYKSFSPYVAAGVGGARFDPSDSDSSNRFLADFGGGVKYWVSDSLAIRADLRDKMTFNDTFHNIEATIGVVIGKRPKPKVVPVEAEAPPTPPPPAIEEKAAPPPPPPPPPVEKPPVTSLEKVHFDFDKSDISPEAKGILDGHIEAMKNEPDIMLIIEGHACAHGPDEYNLGLSKRRADNVRDYFAANGITPERLKTEYYGESRLAMPEIPTAENKYSLEAVANRRVEFVIIK